MVYRSSRRQAQREGAPESLSLQPEPSVTVEPDFDKSEKSRRQAGRWRLACLVLLVTVVALLVAVLVLVARDLNSEEIATCGESSTAKTAIKKNKNTIDRSEPSSPGPFHDLTKHEIRQVRSFLEKDPNTRVAPAETGTMDQSVIYMMDLLPPPKAEALKFLDHKGPRPDRRARVLVNRGDLDPPMVHEYSCGPLPDIRSCDLIKSPVRRNPVEFSLRPLGVMEFELVYEKVLSVVDRQIGYILLESYGTTFTQCAKPKDCFKLYPALMATNLVSDISKRRFWVFADYPVEYYSLHPVDFGVLMILDGSQPDQFRADKIWYNGKLYDSMDAFIVWYNNTGVENKLRMTKPADTRDLFSSLNLRGDPQPETPQRPPTLVEPDGHRYSLKDKKVEYLGWSFNFRLSALTGPALYDIRYKGERIAYELSMAEIAVFYAGNSPGPRSTDFVDSGALIGSHSKSLVPGADCPETATFINQTFAGQSVSEPVELKRAFCLFENNNGFPLRRHLSYSKSEGAFYGGMMDSALVIRCALTVVNYDYITDFIFHQNGVIESRVMSTGYITSIYYHAEEDPYGFPIERNLLGNIHHHLFNFKADLDISGTSNRYETLDIVPDTVAMRTIPGRPYHQEKYVRSLKQTEMEGLYKFNFDTPKYHIVHNDAKKTKHGALKGYRISLEGMSKQLLPENVDSEATVAWARHQLVVTQHKDHELVSSSPYAMWDSFHPVTDFTKFYTDNQTIVDQDLVFWITEGLHHIPHTEDLPVTPTVGNHRTFFLLPYNYFEECPSSSSRDQIRVEHIDKSDPSKGVHVIRNGNSRDQCVTPAYARMYEELLAQDPDIVVETNKFRGIF